jgi:FkbM family methyltransferase
MKFEIFQNEYGQYSVPNIQITEYYPDSVANTIRQGKVYEHDTIKYIINNSKGNSIVTAGAYFGDFLPALSKHFKNIFTFEPSVLFHTACLNTIALNNLTNIKIFNQGLGEKKEKLYYQEFQDNQPEKHKGGAARFLDKNKDYGSNLHLKTYHEKKAVLMEVTTVDDMLPDNEIIDILHLDVEGLEQQALTGSLNTIIKYKPLIIIETLPDTVWIEKNLTPLGYKLTQKISHNSCFKIDL